MLIGYRFSCGSKHKLSFFLIFYCNQQMHNYILNVYITTVSLCNLYSYMFRHFCVIIWEFTTIASLSYTRFQIEIIIL